MTDEVLKALLASGFPGAIVIALALYLNQVQKKLTETQEARTRDAQQTVTTILGLVDKQHLQQDATIDALNENTAALRELRQLFAEELRRRGVGGR